MRALLIFIMCSLFYSASFTQQLPFNGDFSLFHDDNNDGIPNCQIPSVGTCPMIGHNCVVNWERSHGTPQILQYGTNYLLFQVGVSAAGEGAWGYTSLNSGRTYNISMWVNSIGHPKTGGYSTGVLKVVATKNLPIHTTINCPETHQEGAPNPASKKEIAEIPVGGTNIGVWQKKEFSVTIPVGETYFQLWLYSFANSGGSSKIEVSIDDILIVEDQCNPTRIFNTGVIPQIDKTGTILAGSSAGTGGSGIVTVSQTENSILKAAKEITFLPEFHATVTSGSFSAVIEPCSGGTSSRNPGLGPLVESQSNNNSTVVVDNELLSIFPNPAKNNIKIVFQAGINSDIQLRLTNSVGVVVNQYSRSFQKNQINQVEMDISSLPIGVYYLQFSNGKESTIRKIIKTK